MSRTSRTLRALLAAAMGSLIAGPALAANGPKPSTNGPSFSVSLNRDMYSAAGQTYVAMTFTSTEVKAAKGFLRLIVPPKQSPRFFNYAFFSWLQSTDPTYQGYVRVEATGCASATLTGLTTGSQSEQFEQFVLTSSPTIEVAFNCNPGQSFVIHWFTNLGTTGFEIPIDIESWPVEISTRKGPDAKWTAGPPLDIEVRPVYVDLGPLPFLTPPVRVVDVEQVPTDPGEQILFGFLGDAIYLDQNVTSDIRIDNVFNPVTGEPLSIVNEDSLNIDQTIQVVGCLDLPNVVSQLMLPLGIELYPFDCDALGNLIIIQNPNGDAFETADHTLYSSTAVIAHVTSYTTYGNNWTAAQSECQFKGGTFATGDPLLNLLWSCHIGDTTSPERYAAVVADLRNAQYCPTGLIDGDPVTVALRYISCRSN